jgi:c-di-GMP-related signal transduction protein
MFELVYQEVMADFIECLGEVHNENISLFTIIQVSSHVVDELYKLSFTRSKFAKAMLEGV